MIEVNEETLREILSRFAKKKCQTCPFSSWCQISSSVQLATAAAAARSSPPR